MRSTHFLVVGFFAACASAQVADVLTLSSAGAESERRGQYALAESRYRTALGLCEPKPSLACSELPSLLNSLGSVLYLTGRYEDARPLLERALRLRESDLGPTDVRLVPSLNNLSGLLREAGDLRRADEIARRSVEIVRATNPDNAMRAAALRTLGGVLEAEGRFTEASQAFEESLALTERLSPADPTAVADSLNSLGLVYRKQDQLQKASALYQRAASILRAHPGPALPAVINNLASVRAAQGKKKEAERLYREAIDRWEHLYGPDHPHVAAALNSLAVLQQSRGRLSEAERLLARARAIDERSFPANHVRIAFDCNNQAALAATRKQYRNAEALLARALDILEHNLPAEHPEIGKVWANLAETYAAESRAEDAGYAFQHGLEILSKAWGPTDRRLLHWLDEYVSFLRAKEDFAGAAAQEMKATRIRTVNLML